jgi:hypothetical protein
MLKRQDTQRFYRKHKNLESHWQSTFNRHDETALEEIHSYETIDSLGQPPEKNEIKAAIKKMKCDRAPGATGLY